MNVVESYSTSTSFNYMLDYATTAAAAVVTEHMKNDFQNAIRRNLHNWARWRTELNDRLVEAVMSGTHQLQTAADVEPIGQYLQRDAPDPDHPTTNPRTLLTFSAAANSSTPLPSAEFYKFGIPRARLDLQRLYPSTSSVDVLLPDDTPTKQQTTTTEDGYSGRIVSTQKYPAASSPAGGSDSSPQMSLSDDVSRYHSVVVDDGDDDDDDLVFDYFNYTDDKASNCQQHQNLDPNLPKRRFHRSAAILPTVPSLSDGVINYSDHTTSGRHQASSSSSSSSSAVAKKSEQRRKMYQQQPPQTKQSTTQAGQIAGSKVEAVFGGPFGRQRIVTARRDDKLYSHRSAWHLDELPCSWSSRV